MAVCFYCGLLVVMFFQSLRTSTSVNAFLTLLQLAVSLVRSITNANCHLSLSKISFSWSGAFHAHPSVSSMLHSIIRGNHRVMHGATRPWPGRGTALLRDPWSEDRTGVRANGGKFHHHYFSRNYCRHWSGR